MACSHCLEPLVHIADDQQSSLVGIRLRFFRISLNFFSQIFQFEFLGFFRTIEFENKFSFIFEVSHEPWLAPTLPKPSDMESLTKIGVLLRRHTPSFGWDVFASNPSPLGLCCTRSNTSVSGIGVFVRNLAIWAPRLQSIITARIKIKIKFLWVYLQQPNLLPVGLHPHPRPSPA